MELGELFVKIGALGVDETKKNIKEIGDEGGKTESKLGKVFGGIGKGALALGKAVGVGLMAGTTALIGLGKQSIEAYSNYEQLVGGVETLFKDSADTVIANSQRAYMTAGLSANEYMETVTSFSASLLQSLGGDTVKSAEMADMAITDMADNANKMGSDMESIQNAYQNFAKQNYTMLDNLKLGYGGSKEEMERLLADAEKISGIKYDISSYADVVSAIHVMQEEMGIAGTTSREASTTIQGSIGMMKSAWENLVTGMSDSGADLDELINNFVESVGTVGENVLPKITTFLSAVSETIGKLVPKIASEIPNLLNQVLPGVIEGATNIVNAIVDSLPALTDAIINSLPQFIDAFVSITDGLLGALPQLITTLVEALPQLIPQLIDGIVSGVMMIIEMIPQIIQPIIDNLPTIITSIIDALVNNLPIIIDGLIQFIVAIVGAMPEIIQALIDAIPQIITSIVNALITAVPQLLAGIGQITWEIIKAIMEIFGMGDIAQSIENAFKSAWDLVKTVWDAVKPYFDTIVNAIKSIFEPVKNFFKGVFETAWLAIKMIWDTVKDYFKAVWDSIAQIFSVVKNVLTGNFSDAWEGIKGIVGTWVDFFKGIWERIKAIWDFVKTYFSRLFIQAVQNIKSAFEPIVSWFKGIWEKIKGAFKVSDMSSIGSNLITGLWNGIGSKVEWLKSQVKGVVDKIKGWFTGKDGFDEHSPSKWSEKVMAFVMDGLVIGALDKEGKVLETVDDIVSNIKNRIAKITDAWDVEGSIANKLYQLWLLQNPDATDEEKYQKQIESLTSQQEAQGEVVNAVNFEYEKAIELYGENSDEARKLKDELLDEQIAYEKLGESIREVNRARAESLELENAPVVSNFQGLLQKGLETAKNLGLSELEQSNFAYQYANAGGSGFSYKKMATGGIVSRSTIANIGENGAEAVLPLEKNTGWMDKLAEKINGTSASDIIDALRNVKVYLDKNTVVGALAPAIDSNFGNVNIMRGRGN